MASSTVIPVSEYLNTSYRPDRDYLDGELKERNMGEQPHARLQMILGRIFDVKRREWGIRVLAEQRIQTSAEHYRIADVCVLRSSDPKDPIVRFAPLLCVEILSKDDSVGELQERVSGSSTSGRLNPGNGLAMWRVGGDLCNPPMGFCALLEQRSR